MMTSLYPCLMFLYASPIVCVPDAQAETIPKLGPFALNSMEIFPAIAFGIIIGTSRADALAMLPFLMHFVTSLSSVAIPPIPVPP